MTMTKDNQIPSGWALAKLDDVAYLNPRSWHSEPADQQPVSFVPMAAVEEETGRLNPSFARPYREVRKGYTRFQDGDVLFAKITPCMENGKFALARDLVGGRGAGSTEFHVLRPFAGLESKFLLFFLFQDSLRGEARLKMKGAAGQLRVPPEFLAELTLPFPPLAEQRRIVAEIEKQFTRLDAAVAALKRVQANLKRYRASVFNAACRGRLVPTESELARLEGRSYETAEQLLARILAERRAPWEAHHLAKMTDTRMKRQRDKWEKKYKEPIVPDSENLPNLPTGWTWATLSQLSEIQGGIQKQPSRRPANNPYPFLRVANVLRGKLDLSDVHQIEVFGDELEKLRLQSRDLLIVEGNGSPTEIGRMAIWTGEIENCVHQNHIIRARLFGGIPSSFVASYWNSSGGTARVLDVASSTSGLYTLSVSKVGRLPIPLPPLAEQTRIVAEVERHLSVVEEQEAIVEANIKRAQRLRQAILKRALEGRLVPQDPNDEPASALLERIRAEGTRYAPVGSTNEPPNSTRRKASTKAITHD